MPGIEDLMRMIEGQGGAQAPKERVSKPEIAITTLREYLGDYTAPCRFAPGDIITPKKSSMMGEFHGRPFIVAEVFDPPIRMQGRADKITNTYFGAKIDVRLLHEHHESIIAHTAESWMFEPFVAATSTDRPAN